jgi:hypothetical protein
MGEKLEFNSWQRQEIFLFPTTSRLALGPVQPPMLWILQMFPWVKSGRGVKLTTHLHLVLRL